MAVLRRDRLLVVVAAGTLAVGHGVGFLVYRTSQKDAPVTFRVSAQVIEELTTHYDRLR